jgi:hypothetical protein
LVERRRVPAAARVGIIRRPAEPTARSLRRAALGIAVTAAVPLASASGADAANYYHLVNTHNGARKSTPATPSSSAARADTLRPGALQRVRPPAAARADPRWGQRGSVYLNAFAPRATRGARRHVVGRHPYDVPNVTALQSAAATRNSWPGSPTRRRAARSRRATANETGGRELRGCR